MTKQTDRDNREPSGLAGTTWRAEHIGGARLLDHVPSTLAFTEDGHIQGDGGVHRFQGSYRVAGSRIEFGPIAASRMAGPEAAMRQEARFFSALSGTRPFHQVEDLLVIGEGPDAVRFWRADDRPGTPTS